LRLWGHIISLGILVSLFFSCRILTGRVPLLATALVVFNISIYYYCSTIRSYGLAVLLIMPCCAAFWRLAQGPSRWNLIACFTFSILACHASYQNSYLLFAIGIAAAGVCAVCRLWKRTFWILAICFISGCSMFVYLSAIYEYRDACEILRRELEFSAVARAFANALVGHNIPLLVIWLLLSVGTPLFLIFQTLSECKVSRKTPSLALYLLILGIVAFTSGLIFFMTQGIAPFPWHYTPFIAIAGLIVEAASHWQGNKAWRWLGRVTLACIIIVVSLPSLWEKAFLRRTNMDLICNLLAEDAHPNDLILVNPFWLSPNFKYYYHGQAQWNTLPLTATDVLSSVQPYARIKQLMTTADPLEKTIEEIRNTLSSNNRVWIVGGVQFTSSNVAPESLPPAPRSPSGWNCYPYAQSWSAQVGFFLQAHAARTQIVPVPVDLSVNDLENEPLILVEGWHE